MTIQDTYYFFKTISTDQRNNKKNFKAIINTNKLFEDDDEYKTKYKINLDNYDEKSVSDLYVEIQKQIHYKLSKIYDGIIIDIEKIKKAVELIERDLAEKYSLKKTEEIKIEEPLDENKESFGAENKNQEKNSFEKIEEGQSFITEEVVFNEKEIMPLEESNSLDDELTNTTSKYKDPISLETLMQIFDEIETEESYPFKTDKNNELFEEIKHSPSSENLTGQNQERYSEEIKEGSCQCKEDQYIDALFNNIEKIYLENKSKEIKKLININDSQRIKIIEKVIDFFYDLLKKKLNEDLINTLNNEKNSLKEALYFLDKYNLFALCFHIKEKTKIDIFEIKKIKEEVREVIEEEKVIEKDQEINENIDSLSPFLKFLDYIDQNKMHNIIYKSNLGKEYKDKIYQNTGEWNNKKTLFDKFFFLISKKNEYKNLLEKENHFISTIKYGFFPGLVAVGALHKPLHKKKKLYTSACATVLIGFPLFQYNRSVKRNQKNKEEIDEIYKKILQSSKKIPVDNEDKFMNYSLQIKKYLYQIVS